MKKVAVIGAGLAGCEAAWHLTNRGVSVDLYEMKPGKKSPAHRLDTFAELVCSNSLRSDRLENAVGLLKEEMRVLGSLTMECAGRTKVPAGGALAVDREGFSRLVTDNIKRHRNINVIEKEIDDIPDADAVIIATGPLTSDAMAKKIKSLTGSSGLFFYDAVAPIVTKESIDFSKAFFGSRYGRGSDYINCPMDESQYKAFYEKLVAAQTADIRGFEEKHVFEGCMPIESMAKRGYMTMAFGPLKPVGITDEKTGKRPFAVVQLRQDDAASSLYNIVGFQTRLKFPEQKRVFSMIPGLEKADFARYGVMHKNTYIDSPRLLTNQLMLEKMPGVFFAGQITGVEGYVESAASGIWAGICTLKYIMKYAIIEPDDSSMTGALVKYCTNKALSSLSPMNANFGIIAPLGFKVKGKRNRAQQYSKRALSVINDIAKSISAEDNNGI